MTKLQVSIGTNVKESFEVVHKLLDISRSVESLVLPLQKRFTVGTKVYACPGTDNKWRDTLRPVGLKALPNTLRPLRRISKPVTLLAFPNTLRPMPAFAENTEQEVDSPTDTNHEVSSTAPNVELPNTLRPLPGLLNVSSPVEIQTLPPYAQEDLIHGLNSGTARISQLVSHVVSVSTPSVPLSSSNVSTTALSSTTGLESTSGDDTKMRVTCASKISAHVEASS